MNYKTYIYIISVLISTFVISGINFNGFFKKNKEIEAKFFVVILALIMGYLLGAFVITFIECSKII